MSTGYRSDLVKATDSQTRNTHGPFPLPKGFVEPSGEHVHGVKVKVLVSKEEGDALMAAHKAMGDVVYEGAEGALNDIDFNTDFKLVYSLYKAFRAEEDPKHPAFFDHDWIRTRYSTDKIAYLVNLYFACRKAEEVLQFEVDDARLEHKLMQCAQYQDSEVAEAVIADLTEPWLRTAFILIAAKLEGERKALYRTRAILERFAVLAGEQLTPNNSLEMMRACNDAAAELQAEEPWGTVMTTDPQYDSERKRIGREEAIALFGQLAARAGEVVDPAEVQAAAAADVVVEPAQTVVEDDD